MKKLESSFKNMSIVLTLVAIVTASLLAYVNDITAKPIRDIQAKQLADGINKVIGVSNLNVATPDTVKKSIEGKIFTFVVYKTTDKNNKSMGTAVQSITDGFGGPLAVLVGFDSDGNIKGYTILQTQETPGLGVKAAEWFQKGNKGCIIGKKAGELKVSKDGGDVDAITASTITSRAFLKAVNQAYLAISSKKVDGESGASKQEHK
jgi:Na+-translocating ferredoxin:NAD+ oxidoreductase subunit G